MRRGVARPGSVQRGRRPTQIVAAVARGGTRKTDQGLAANVPRPAEPAESGFAMVLLSVMPASAFAADGTRPSIAIADDSVCSSTCRRSAASRPK